MFKVDIPDTFEEKFRLENDLVGFKRRLGVHYREIFESRRYGLDIMKQG
jgi:hypothetical protein